MTAGPGKSWSAGGAGCLLLFSLPFIAGGAFIISLFAREFLDYRRAGSWERVPVRIESAELIAHQRSKGGVDYEVRASYSYEYRGAGHTGSKVSPESDVASDSRQPERAAILEHHQQTGEPFLAWVNPADPDESMLFRELTPTTWMLVPFGLVFLAAGTFVAGVGVQGWRKNRRRMERLAREPGRPWRADERWADGFVFDAHAGANLAAGWGMAIFLTLFCGLFVFMAMAWGAPLGIRIIVCLFGLIGPIALVFVTRSTLCYAKYGSPKLVLAELPAIPGRTLRAIVLCQRHVATRGSFRAVLKCLQTTGSGKSRITTTLHESSVEIPHERDSSRERDGTALPVEIALPGDLPETSEPQADASVKWTLAVSAATPGVDFLAEFDLPVFRVENESRIEKRPYSSGAGERV